MEAAMYPENDTPAEAAKRSTSEAVRLGGLLDLLDDMEKQEQEWWTVKIESKH
jgi:hypothetical protein